MSTPTQIQPTTAAAPGPLAADLRRCVDGDVHAPGEPGYDGARMPWNVAAEQHPAAVVVPRDAADVVAVMQVAAASGLRVAPQGPGHGAMALGTLRDTILLRTAALGGVTVDPAAKVARVGAGVQMGALITAAAPHGLAPVSGSTGGVSAVGFSLGGGMGWLSRQLGLAASHVTAIELVTADGERVRATATEEPDLFWAMRGGGGDFGVVTAMELALHDVPWVTAGMMMWPLERAGEVLPAWRDWTRTAPEAATTSLRLIRFPPFEQIPEPIRGRAFVIVDGAITGEPWKADACLRKLRAMQPVMDSWTVAGPAILPEVHQDPVDPTPAMHGHVLLGDADDRVLEGVMQLAGPGADTALLFAELRHLGGALGRRAPGGGALDHIRGSYLLAGVGVPMGPAAAAVPAQLRELECVGVHQSAGAYANFADAGSAESMFAPAVLARLRAIKAAVDPGDRIQSNHPVR